MTVRVAAVGTGRWGKTLADAAGRGTGLSIVACTSRSAENRATFAKTYGCRDLPTLDAVLADRDVEAIIITTPHTAHADQVVAAARAGKHVFVDKPFTLTVADARRAAEACRGAGVVLAVGHQRRKQAASRALKRLVDEGAFGRVAQIEGNFSADYGFSSTLTTQVWRGDRAEAPGGAMTNLGIHHVDTYQYLLGPIAPSRKSRSTTSRRSSSSSPRAASATSVPRGFTPTAPRRSRCTAPKPRPGTKPAARSSSSPGAARPSARKCH